MGRGRMIAVVRRYGLLAAVVAVVALVAGGVPPVGFTGHRGLGPVGVLAPGSSGSIAHRSWWDPRGWLGGGGGVPRPRVIAAGGGPQTARMPRQVAAPPVRRVAELAAKRTVNARVYQLADGRQQAVISAVPVNYQDARGRWQPIDTTVRPTARAGFVAANTSNTFGSFFGDSASRLVRFEVAGGGWLSVGLDGGHVGRPVVAGDTVGYAGVAPGAGLSYRVTPDALKESIVLASAAAARPLSFTVAVGGGLVPWQRPDGSIALSRAGVGGAPVLVLPRPVMTDARPQRWSPYGTAWSPKVAQRVSWDAAAHVLHVTVSPDGGWLRQAVRRFPVVVDPTIMIAPTPTTAQNTFIEQDTPSSNYDSSWRLSVGTTSGGAVRALLKFPLSAIPAGTQIDSADLRLYADQYFGAGTSQAIQADQATAAWDASTATWSNASANVGTEGLNEVIVDDSDSAHTAAAGAWPSASASAATNGEYRYDQDTTAGDTFSWVPKLTEAGSYYVADHYVATSTAATNAPFTLTYSGGSQAYTVNQQSGSGGVWAVLGQKPFVAGTAGKVVLGDGPATSTTRVIADAARWRLWGAATADGNNANIWHSFPVRNIVQSWLNGSANYGFVVRSSSESTLNLGGPRYEASRFAYQGEVATYPQLVVTYGTPGIALNQITTIHATGAQLSWPAYTDPTPGTNPGDDLAEYQVHRSVFQSFVPSASTLVAPVAAGTTSFTDTTNTPTPPGGTGNAFYYMLAVKTQDGSVISGPVALVRLPTAGTTIQIVNAAGDTTLSKAQPTTNERQLAGQPWLAAGDNSTTYGVTRTVVNYPTMASAGIPADATVTDAELKLWGWYNNNTGGGSATYDVHALTQSFDPATATWNNASSTTAWATAGGAYASAVTGSVTGLTNDPNRQEWPVTSTVQGWITTPASEDGLLLRLHSESTSGPQEQELFLNSSAQEAALRPELVVYYTEPTAADTYYAPSLPDPLGSAASYTVPVTVTNTTASTWTAADWVLSYHWLLPDGTDVSNSTNQVQTPLAADMAPTSVATLNAAVKTPDTTGTGADRTGYTLAWDLFDKTTGTWLSSGTSTPSTTAAGAVRLATRGGRLVRAAAPARPAAPMASGNNNVPVLKQNASVEQPGSNLLGLEKFYQYTGVNTGAGSALLNNADAGNVVWSYNALSNPSRGFATFVRLAYNSMDTSDSAMGFGWSLQTSTLMRLGTPLNFLPNPHPTTVMLTDGDGTSHLFTWDSANSVWKSPPGVHYYLQQLDDCSPNGKDPASRAWLLTRPDRTQFYFDCQGYQSAVVDNNGNEADFTYTQRNSNNKPVKFLDYITDPSGRQTLTLTYYAKGDNYSYIDANGNVATGTNLTDPQIIDQVKTVTDISGRTLTFLYTVQGLMAQMTDGAGSTVKTFKFGYDMTQGNKNVKLVAVTDPRGNTTGLTYYTAPQDPKFKWSLETITDRRGGTTGFAYTEPAPGQPTGSVQTAVTDQNNHTSTYALDPTGRPVQITNALGQITKLAWDGDNNVSQLTEDNGAVTTWTYDPNTGYPLTHKDALANQNATAATTYTYQTGLSGHIADLISKLTPQQRLWTFGYDANGNLTSVTDPDGNATGAAAGSYTTKYAYDSLGQLATATDANGNPTTYSNYDPNGYPQTITDALGHATKYVYDVRGNVTQVTDPLNHVTTQAYDVFGRPGQNVAPKDQASGVTITTPAPLYDGNDNITQATAPNGAVSTYTYDPNDEKTAEFAPQDTPSGPQRETSYGYDPAGNLTSTTEPDGNQPSPPSSFTTTYAYDTINEMTGKTDAAAETTSYGYDDVGNRTSVTDPLNHVTKQAYDLDHRPTVTTDPGGFTTSKAYDLDGLVISTTDQNGNTTLNTLDPRGDLTQVQVPHDTSGGTTTYNTTQYAYDQVGNRTMVVTPRGVAAGVTNTCTKNCAFTLQTTYDADNRVLTQSSAYDPNDPTVAYRTPATTAYSYDPAGRVAQLTAPSSNEPNGQNVPNVTKYTYWDNGWTKTSTDPWNIATSFDYNNLGEQITRIITSAGGDLSRTMTRTYFPDGKLSSLTDDGVPTGLYSELVDNSDFNNTSSTTGTWTTSTAGSGFEGYNYATHAGGSGSDAFIWNLNIPQDGNYKVYVKYPAVPGAATNASFKVSYSGGTATVAVDQTKNTGTWVALGTWAFTQGGAGQKITLTENTTSTVVADAVKVVRDNSADTNTAHHDFGYSYDPNGNLTGISDTSPGTAISNYVISYDGVDRLSQVLEQASGVTKHTTTYGYDAAGNLTSRGHDAATFAYVYNPRNLLTKETDATSSTDPSPQVTTFTYTPTRQVKHEVKANSNTVDYTYFADDLPQTQTENTSGATLVASHAYTYNPNGDKTQDTEKLMSADNNGTDLSHTLTYTYDPRDRIETVAKDGTTTESYTHDANDNVVSQTVNNVNTTFGYDRNRLLTATTNGATADYNYDPFGRLDTVTSGSTVLQANTYDGFDHIIRHLQQNSSGGTDTTNYTYDPLNRRTSQTTGGKETDYAYLGLSNDLITESSLGQVTKSYDYTPSGLRLSQTTHNSDGTTANGYYSYNDHSDVEAVTGTGGTTTATYGYTAYGQNDTSQFTGADKNNATPGPTTQPYNPYRYNAMRWDSATGQYDMGFRTYDSSLNQFLSRDMYNGALADMALDTDPFTGNRYTFGAGNPVSNIELDGHMLVAPGGGGGCPPSLQGCPGYTAPRGSTSTSGGGQAGTSLPTCPGGVAIRFAGPCTPPPMGKQAPGGSLSFLAGLGDSFVSLLDLGMTAANPFQGIRNMATGNTFSGAYTRWMAAHGVNTSSHSTYTGGIWAGAVLQMGAGGLASGIGGAADAADAAVGSARFAADTSGVVTDLGPRVAAGRPVVIGEGMQARVIPAAQKLGADWYQPPPLNDVQSMVHDRVWINEVQNQGRGIVDIGAAPGRANFPEPTSPWYSMELEQISQHDYPYYLQFPWNP